MEHTCYKGVFHDREHNNLKRDYRSLRLVRNYNHARALHCNQYLMRD